MHEPYKSPADTGVGELVSQVLGDSNIKVYLNATVAKTDGAPGRFVVDIATESGATHTEDIGAIVQASGFTLYDMNKLPELGGGKSANVVDQAGLEALAIAAAAGDGVIRRPSDNQPVKSVVFVQCAGQRDPSGTHLAYCSGYCCNTSIKQAMYFKDANPSVDTTIIYTDLRTPGNGEDFYRSAQEKGVIFTKGKVARSGAQRRHQHGEIPRPDSRRQRRRHGGCRPCRARHRPGAELGHQHRRCRPGCSRKARRVVEVKPISILNLTYRQGKDVPQLKQGFTDSHFICFPYETRRTGIYTAGPVRRPMDIAQAREDATGAALKSIQALENAELGRAAHPRSGDLSFPKVRLEGCTQCKRCTVECPFGAIDEDEKRFPVFNESRCRRCGTCMGACPVRVISFENYSVNTVGAQIKAVDIPDEFSEKPRILILACENDAYPALDMAGMGRNEYSAFVRIIPIRCLGSVNTIWITDALNAGYDGVMMMGCKSGDEYQCHFVKGSELGRVRMSKIDDTLKTLNLESERVRDLEVAITDIERVPEMINKYAAELVAVGPSPFKGF